jgi:arginine decarboxylase
VRKWRIEDSEERYFIKGWGTGYFGINDKGNVYVSPNKDDVKIDLLDIIDDLSGRDIGAPMLLRFPEILGHRIKNMSECFKKASKTYDFKGQYYSIYPIKVNQVQPVVDEVIKHGKQFNIGLEAGSKPELHAVLGNTDSLDSLIICNGYKDEEFIELALLAQKMGREIYIVVEKMNELRQVIAIGKRINIRPNIGIRIKLVSGGSGKWEDSGGDRSKFGLNASELLEAISIIEEEDLLDMLKLIHFHIGSQVTNIRKIKNALTEAAQFYVELKKLKCNVEYVDIGGGLGVDYDGSKSSNPGSINYTIQEYANDAVFTFGDAAEKNGFDHPNIISESGRSMTAHHSILIFNVLETASLPSWDFEETIDEENHELVQEMNEIYEKLSKRNLLESWHDAQQIREEALDRFNYGLLPLETRARTERFFWTIAREVNKLSNDIKHMPDELRTLDKVLSDKYFCNFSLFQSLPDSWAVDQIFPIMPIHRLDEKPDRQATLQDITCDSDGKIDNFVGLWNNIDSLPVHSLREDENYYLGTFLVGAYQEILGDMHNLFGDTNAVHIYTDGDGYEIRTIIDGESVADVLKFVQFDDKKLVKNVEKWVAQSVKANKISQKEGKEFLSTYSSGLYGYTYLE